MKAEDLRIGNWVEIKDHEVKTYAQVEGIGNLQQVAGQLWSIEELEPIPLTEDWLERFGFKKYQNGFLITPTGMLDFGYFIEYYDWREDWSVGILYYDPVRDCDIDEIYKFNVSGSIIYVHQLQNLYFALTGEELTIKE